MSSMKINMDDFQEQLEYFEDEYDRVFESALPIGMGDNINEVWAATRATVLPQYPLLEYLYNQHGNYRNVPWEDQPQAAKLGRKVAGVMASVVRRYDNPNYRYQEDLDEEEEEAELLGTETVQYLNQIEEATLYTDKEVGDASEVQRTYAKANERKRRRPDRSDSLVRALTGLEPGQYARLTYPSEKVLRRDQSLLRIACRRLGWFQGLDNRYIPWESWMETDEDGYHMIVVRLEEPKLKRRRS